MTVTCRKDTFFLEDAMIPTVVGKDTRRPYNIVGWFYHDLYDETGNATMLKPNFNPSAYA
jgi:hypothetical protein